MENQKDPLTPIFITKDEINQEFELRDRPSSHISHWWKTLTLSSYFVIAISGIASSISIGDLLAAFADQCIFYTNLKLKDLENLGGNKTLTKDNIDVEWGDLYDCHYCEYFSASSVVFGGMLFALFLQCGRGGVTERSDNFDLLSGSVSWGIVPIAFLIDLIFFIMSSVAFAKTIGGLSFFCSNALRRIESVDLNITSCRDILSFRYPWNIYGTDLYLDYLIAQIGMSIHFIGWFMALAIILLRCLLGVDFVVYQRKQYGIITTIEPEEKQDIPCKWDYNSDCSYTEEQSDGDETTSFIP